MTKPNFIIIGAARSGTTSLYKYLEPHPDIFMSEIKEINYFSNSRYFSKGAKWYEKHFNNATQKLRGEASTSYTSAPSLPNVPRHIYEYLGPIKLIYVVRDPIDRLVSHYLHRVGRGLESRDLEDIIDNYPNDPLLWQGRYYYQLEQYLEFFPKENIYVLSIDEIKSQGTDTIVQVYNFLGVDPARYKAELSTHNANSVVTKKNFFGQKVLDFYHTYIEQNRYPYAFKKIFLAISEIGASEIKFTGLTEKHEQKLISFYRDDIKSLKAYKPVSMESWRDYR